jgi:heme/copper-type cytochrome/quinol oxidase subunit 2
MFIAMLRYRDGVEPVENMDKYHIEVGSFPVDSHNTKLEVLFYVLPTIIVVWLTMMALASNTAVWTLDENEESFDIQIVGKQWFWEFHYTEALTWEDPGTDIDVDWTGNMLMVHAHNTTATNITIAIDGVETDYELDASLGMLTLMNTMFDAELHSKITVFDNDDQLLHTWEHLPIGTILSTAGGQHLLLPCDKIAIMNLHSQPSDASNPNYVGVQHSFWLPEWGVKEDLVPGLEAGTVMYAQPDDMGTFPIRCAEYCGLDHSKMQGQVTIVAPEGDTCEADTGVKKTDNGGAY